MTGRKAPVSGRKGTLGGAALEGKVVGQRRKGYHRLPGPGRGRPLRVPSLLLARPAVLPDTAPTPCTHGAPVSPLGWKGPFSENAQVLLSLPWILPPTHALVIILVWTNLCLENVLPFIPFDLAFTSHTRPATRTYRRAEVTDCFSRGP